MRQRRHRALSRRRGGQRRWVPTVVLIVVLLAVAFFAGGGWYFAGQIRSDGLTIAPNSPEYDLTVVRFDHGHVQLRESPGYPRDRALRKSDVYGLGWLGGSGVLGSTGSPASDGSVVRALTVTEGAPPKAGTKAELRTAVYDDPGSAYGARFHNVTYDCAGGSCPAWYLPGPSKTWAILVHGKGSTRTEPLRALGSALKVGMPALVIAYRNDQGAPRDPSGYYRYGATEWHDLDNAVGYAVRHGARHVVLFGFSMGGGIVAAFMEHSAHADLVRGLVLDAPMLDFRKTVDYGASQRRLPLIGAPIPGPLTWTAETIAGHQYGVAWTDIDYLDGNWLHVPALVFHGTADDTVPISTSDSFTKRYPRLVHEVRVDGASHVESWNTDPARFAATTTTFLSGVGAQR